MLRSYACLSRRNPGFRNINVTRTHPTEGVEHDQPVFDTVWSQFLGTTGVFSAKVRSHAGRLGRTWDYYRVYYKIPFAPLALVDPASIRLVHGSDFIGELVIVRCTRSGHRLLDMRQVDLRKVISLIRT